MSRDSGGDFGALPRRSAGDLGFICSRPSPSGGGVGGRFWALAEDLEDSDAVSRWSEDAEEVESPRAVRASPTIGDFVQAAEELGGSLRATRRSAFAPGGRCSRFPSCGGPGSGLGASSCGRSPRSSRRTPCCGSGWPRERASPPHPSLRRAVEAPSPGCGTTPPLAAQRRSPRPAAGDGCDTPLVWAWLGDGPVLTVSPVWEAQEAALALLTDDAVLGSGLALSSSGEEERGLVVVCAARPTLPPARGAVSYPAWLWIRKGSSDISLGFPASEEDVRRRRSARRIRVHPPPPPLVRSFAQIVAMDKQQQRGGNQQGQRKGGAGRGPSQGDAHRREEELRSKALEAQGKRAHGGNGGQGSPWKKSRCSAPSDPPSPARVFFYLDFEDDPEEEDESNGPVISFKETPLSKEDLTRELHHLVEVVWDWQVMAISAREFAVVFPTRDILRMCTRSGRLFLPLSGVDAEIRLGDSDPKPAVVLKEAWVRLTGLPRRMRREDRLWAGLTMLGRIVEVDVGSIAERRPVRVKVACRVPSKMKGLVQIFHKNSGYNIGAHLEPPRLVAPAPPSPPPLPPPRTDDFDDDDVDDLSPTQTEWEALGKKDAPKKASAAAPRVAGSSKGQSGGSKTAAPAEGTLAAPADAAQTAGVRELPGGTTLDEYGSNLGRGGSWPVPLVEIEKLRAKEALVVAPRVQVADAPTSPPVDSSGRDLAGASTGEEGEAGPREAVRAQDEDMMMEAADGEAAPLDLGGETPGGLVPRRRRTMTVPAGPPRKSARLVPAADVAVPLQAEMRAAAKDTLSSDTKSTRDFAVLQDLPDEHLVAVVHDVGLAFAVERGSESEILFPPTC
ncbi:unnamed protein product [Alopecurus aequalis]